MWKIAIAGISVALIASIAIVGAILYASRDAEDDISDQNINWNAADYSEGPPPKPQFNIYDNEDCIIQVKDFYESGKGSYESTIESEEELDGLMQELLNLMKKHKFTLIDNKEFYEWSISPRYDDYMPPFDNESSRPVSWDD